MQRTLVCVNIFFSFCLRCVSFQRYTRWSRNVVKLVRDSGSKTATRPQRLWTEVFFWGYVEGLHGLKTVSLCLLRIFPNIFALICRHKTVRLLAVVGSTFYGERTHQIFDARIQIRLTSECVANVDSGRRLYVLLRRQRSTFHRPVMSPLAISNRAFGVARCCACMEQLNARRHNSDMFNRSLDCDVLRFLAWHCLLFIVTCLRSFWK